VTNFCRFLTFFQLFNPIFHIFSEQDAILILIEKITVIIEGYYSFSQTLVLIYQELEAFFVQYPDLKILIFTAEIEGFGIIRSYYELCAVVSLLYLTTICFPFSTGALNTSQLLSAAPFRNASSCKP
jgi:hypothetical protein